MKKVNTTGKGLDVPLIMSSICFAILDDHNEVPISIFRSSFREVGVHTAPYSIDEEQLDQG